MEKMISIWFFIGLLLIAYGVIILGAGIYTYLNPIENTVVLSELHAGIWWGLLILVLGLYWTITEAPKKD